ncbi:MULTISPECIES: hypothetical protein [Microcystis]|jgi:hypothetical protein|uniref:Lipoprotein n=3 Tax=Microcystis TaxID=1125 RepID=A0A402DKF2_MICAE|nr:MULTISPECIES: hypothetical protein [Microcystis]MBD2599731.1 hypothetical protein [Microcystis viridis FACHB-1342]MBE9245647.1 hypothetical protein [Microcystis aeruginosa LEGE 00239]GCE62700.1 hypothetical protein MiAbB_04649 [Microcystis aeruginosa NIES-4285]
MIMFIKVSQLMAISLLLLVGCSEKSNNTNDSNLPGSSSTPAQIPSDKNKSKNLAPIPEMVQNVVNAVHQKIQNGEIDLAKENNLNIREINIRTTGGGSPFGDMIYVENVDTKALITIRWIQSANGYELVGYAFPSHDIKFNCPGPCPMYYPQ